MKRVLIFAYYYPPCNTAGSYRAGCMAKYLPEFGWKPLVITKLWTPENCSYDPDCVKNLPPEHLIGQVEAHGAHGEGSEVGEGLFGILGRQHYQEFFGPRTYPPHWTRNVLRALPEILDGHEVDAVWGTYRHNGNLHLARRCAKELGVPWIADFRDVPGQSGAPEVLRHRLLQRRMIGAQKHLVKTASAITTVSEGLAEVLREQHKRDVRVIMNGFDPEEMVAGKDVEHPTFTLTYTGCLYEARSPRPILDALATLIDQGKADKSDIRVEFYGDPPDRTGEDSFLKGYGHREIVTANPWVRKEKCDDVCRSSTVLLLPTKSGAGVLTSKLFSYLAAQRPILAGPMRPGGIAEVLSKTGAGVACTSVQEIAHQLLQWYTEWKATGTVRYEGRRDAVMKYSRKEQARQLAEVLDGLGKA